jgi:hypothetical protein
MPYTPAALAALIVTAVAALAFTAIMTSFAVISPSAGDYIW